MTEEKLFVRNILNSEFKPTKRSIELIGTPFLAPDKYYTSKDVKGSSKVPEPGDSCAENSDSTNVQEICVLGATSNDARNASQTDSGLIACVSGSDEFDIQETRLDAFTSTSNTSNGPLTNSHTLRTEDVDSVVNELLKSSDSSAIELDDSSYIKMTKKVTDVYRNLIELLESIHSSAIELDGKDFMKIANTVRNCQKRGMFPPLMIFEIKKSILGYYKKEFNKDIYLQIQAELRCFNSNYKVHEDSEQVFYPKLPKIMEFLKDNDNLPEEMCLKYTVVNEEENDIKRKLDEYKSFDILGIVELLKNLHEAGILSDVVLSDFKIFADKLKELRLTMNSHIEKMFDIITKISKVCTKYHSQMDEAEPMSKDTIDFFMTCRSDVSTFLDQVKRPDIKPKISNCRFEHSTPFCGTCGWRTSWLIAFKKRGIFVKEDLSGISENIWYI